MPTDKENLIPPSVTKNQAQAIYASEADILNVALFGKTAKNWRDENKEKEGNIRDYCDVLQSERLVQLNQIAIIQIRSLVENASIKKLK